MLNQGLLAGTERDGQGVELLRDGLSAGQGPAGGPSAMQLHLGWLRGRAQGFGSFSWAGQGQTAPQT